jgi:hypothetical protein
MRAIVFATLAACASPALAQVPAASPTMLADGALLEVSATGRTTRTPDVAIIRAGVVTQSATAAMAMTENAQRIARVLTALKRAGVADRDVQTATISLSPQYRYQQNEAPVITGYQASNTVTIRFREVARSGAILDALVREGANQIDGPNLTIDKPDAASDEARVDAVARARARAELYARAAGMRVERIVSIGESGDFNPSPMPPPMVMMRAQAADAESKIAPGEQEVAVTVNVRFLLK